MITFSQKGDFKKTFLFLENAEKRKTIKKLNAYGAEGVRLLSKATPIDTGKTANSWGYEIHYGKGSVSITWTNSNLANYVPVVFLLEYGHATRNGGYVQGHDFINPAIQPLFDKMSNETWKEVTE